MHCSLSRFLFFSLSFFVFLCLLTERQVGLEQVSLVAIYQASAVVAEMNPDLVVVRLVLWRRSS